MRFLNAIFCALGAILCCPESCCDGAVKVQVSKPNKATAAPERELPVIAAAAARNNCTGDDYFLLLAIRLAENGRAGCEFGVKGRAWETDLDTQAGWAAATIVKNRYRWNNSDAVYNEPFIDFLADRYCPKSTDPEGNRHWKRNVLYWFRKLKKGGE